MPVIVSSPPSSGAESDVAEPVDGEGKPLAFGKYRLLQRIARGGMGEVFRASLVGELGFEKPLVIKTILPELAAQPRFVDLFAAEAKTAVALSHGNIVPIYELGRAEDTFYIVMAYVDGPSVAELLATHRRRGHPPPLAVALSIIRGVLTGLAYAHTEEPGRPAVVHRDITPRNVMIERSGQVRIVDFGIARPARAAAEVRAGSTGYVSPEQVRAAAVDPRADVFSTGCMLFELLTLERAFPRKGVWAAPSLERVPESLREVLEQALALEPTERPADAGALLQALGPAITAHAATFTEANLAAHLRTLYPDGRWGRGADVTDDELTPNTGVRPTSETFATRLTPVSGAHEVLPHPDAEANADGAKPGPASDPSLATRRRVTIAAAVALGALAIWTLRPGDRDDRPSPLRDDVTVRAAPTPLPSPAVAPAPPDPPPPGPAAESSGGSPDPASTTDAPSSSSTDAPAADPPPTITLRIDPADATVRIGDERLPGTSPYVVPLLLDGALEATIEAPGYATEVLELHAGGPPERVVALTRATQGRGHLQVIAPSVSWAEVTVDGRPRGVTPTRKLELPEGSHRLIVRCIPDVCPEPRIMLRRTIDIEANETTRITVP